MLRLIPERIDNYSSAQPVIQSEAMRHQRVFTLADVKHNDHIEFFKSICLEMMILSLLMP